MTYLTENQIEALSKHLMTVKPSVENGVNVAKISDETRIKVENALKRSCETPCTPHAMLGMSWWKNLGFNKPCKCAEALAEQDFRYRVEYLFAGVWPYPFNDTE